MLVINPAVLKKRTVIPLTQVKYGYLYNWYVTTNASPITSSDDWVVPTDAQWTTLTNYLGGLSVAGGKLKETGTIEGLDGYWLSPNIGAINEVEFNARGGGYRDNNGAFGNIGYLGFWWSASENYASIAWYRYMNGSYSSVGRGSSNKEVGFSIRLLKPSTTLIHGQTGTYTGNDGKVYRTICIDTQEWLADNLAETMYRDKSVIQNVTDSSAWSLLSTGARCAYDNDESNVLI